MRINHLRGPAGSGKSTALQAIYKKQGAKNCLFVGEGSTTNGVLSALDTSPRIMTILIDDFNPKRINLKKIAQHESAPRLVVWVAHKAGPA